MLCKSQGWLHPCVTAVLCCTSVGASDCDHYDSGAWVTNISICYKTYKSFERDLFISDASMASSFYLLLVAVLHPLPHNLCRKS